MENTQNEILLNGGKKKDDSDEGQVIVNEFSQASDALYMN